MNNIEVTELLIYLGFKPNRQGFHYLELVLQEMFISNNITLREAYTKIASMVKGNPCTIDSSIRNVIHTAYDTGKLGRLNLKMGIDAIDIKVCPTNKEFISLLLRYFKSNQIINSEIRALQAF